MSGVDVRIAEGRVVYVDGQAKLAGQVVTVPAAEAKRLVEEGDAERVGAGPDPPARKRKGDAERVGAGSDPPARKRKGG